MLIIMMIYIQILILCIAAVVVLPYSHTTDGVEWASLSNTSSSLSMSSNHRYDHHFTTLSSSSSLSAACDITKIDYNALNDLYTSTNGSTWYTNCNNWIFTSTPNYAAPCNGWYGVTCNSQCRVSKLALDYCGLKGSIPSSIGNLNWLNSLQLSNNNLTFTITSSICSFTGMSYLNLSTNKLVGSIPSSIGSLTNLSYFDLHGNMLSGSILSGIGSLTKLKYIDLSSNSLTGGIPSSIASLIGLYNLDLDTNSLVGTIPLSIWGLTGLTTLDLYNNSLIGSIPSSIGGLTGLTIIDLSNNSLRGSIPSSIGCLTNLNVLALFDNYLTGSIPSSIGSLTKLDTLYLSSNSLLGNIPSSIWNLVGLHYFGLSGNRLTGTIHSSIGSLTGLTDLELFDNSLTGSIPSSIGSLTGLTIVGLSSNSLTGSIPSSIGSLTNLKVLDLASNRLTGPIKGMFPKLQRYRLSKNSLSGTIPSTLTSMTNLNYLYIDGNQLTGTIPSQISALSLLILLYAQDNKLEGSVPVSLFSLKNISYIDLSFNSRLTASINSLVDVISPSSLLNYINLAGIQLTGSLPSALFSLPQLTTLILSQSCISGTIPSSICQSSKLSYLLMDGLSTSGKNCLQNHRSIPACVFSLPSLQTLSLIGNGLTGPLSEVPISSGLSVLNLANNRLTAIPQSIQLHRFDSLDVSFNKITGTLIDSFHVPSTSLDLNENRLSGMPPSSLVHTAKNTSLNVLEGNLFGCPLIENDINSKSVSCGSTSLNNNFIAWLSLVVSIVCLVALAIKLNSHVKLPLIAKLQAQLLQWYQTYLSCRYDKLYHTKHIIDSLERGCSLSLLFVFAFVLIVMTSYIGINKSGNYIYQEQYLYTATAAYSVGSAQVVLIWIFLSLSAFLTIAMMELGDVVSYSTNTIRDSVSIQRIAGENDQIISYKDILRRVTGEIWIELVILALSVGVNMGYVYIVYFRKPTNLSFVQFAFAIIKSLFKATVPIVTKLLPKTTRQLHALFMTIGIIILSPGIATLYTSPLCLLYKFKEGPISSSYEYPLVVGTCAVTKTANTYISDCTVSEKLVSATLSILPPWDYSYQCSSSLLSSYLPNFVFLYILNGIIYPLVHIIVITSVPKNIIIKGKEYISRMGFEIRTNIFYVMDNIDDSNTSKTDSELKMMSTTFNNINDSNDESVSASRPSSAHSNDAYFIEAFGIMPGMCMDITLLLTFGLASPLLAVLIAWSMVINTLLFRLAVGRYIFIVSKAIGVSLCYSSLEDALRDEWQCLSRSWWIMTILIGLFWSLFVNDMIGESDRTRGIVVAVLMMVWCPLVFISSQRQFLSLKRRITQSSDTSSNSDNRSTSTVMYIETLALSVHQFIWTRVLRVGNVRDVVEGSDDDNRDSTNSTINETTSPVGSSKSTVMYIETLALSVHKYILTRVLRVGSATDIEEGSDDNRSSAIAETLSPLGTHINSSFKNSTSNDVNDQSKEGNKNIIEI